MISMGGVLVTLVFLAFWLHSLSGADAYRRSPECSASLPLRALRSCRYQVDAVVVRIHISNRLRGSSMTLRGPEPVQRNITVLDDSLLDDAPVLDAVGRGEAVRVEIWHGKV